MDNTKVVETPNGYKITLRAWVTHTKYFELTKEFTDFVTVNLNEKDETKQRVMNPYVATIELEVQEKFIKYLILKIETKDGVSVDLTEDYLPIPPEDAVVVIDAINEISDKATQTFSKKN